MIRLPARGGPALGPAVLALSIVLALFVACGGVTTPSPSPSPSSDPTGPTPKPTYWPTPTIETTIALGAADAEIGKGFTELKNAADAEDVEKMWGAADGLAKLLEQMIPAVSKLQSYPTTKPLGDGLEVSYKNLHDAAAKIRDSITAGDSAGVSEGFNKMTAAIDGYADYRQELADLATQAIFQKRVLNL